MQEVLIDVTRLVHRFVSKRLPTGVDRVSLAYIKHYETRARAVLRHNGGKFVFRRAESEELFDWVRTLGKNGSPFPAIYKGLLTGCLSQGVQGHFLFNTGHSGLEDDEYVSMLKKQAVRPVFMVHDLIPITHPEFCREGEQTRHLARLRNAIQIASGIVCNSRATMNSLIEFCHENRWEMPPSTVALLAPELPEAIPATGPAPPPYFVFVSTIEPRKNHAMILRIWQKLVQQLGDKTPQLIIIGQRGWGYDEVVSLLEETQSLQRLVIEIPACSDSDMVNYLQNARALLFPSFTEGYGMPVVEALHLGTPVIASDLAVFREFASDIPDYLAANDELSWAQKIMDYASPNSILRKAQLERLRGFAAPTWSNHFVQVDALLGGLVA